MRRNGLYYFYRGRGCHLYELWSAKSMKLLAELDMKKGIGLIERVKRGFGQSDVIYVKNFIQSGLELEQETASPDDQNVSLHEEEKERTPRSEKRTYRGSKSRLIEVRKTNLSGFEKRTYRGSKSEPVEVRKTNLSRSEKQTYPGSKSRLIEVQEKTTLIILIRVRLIVIRLRTARLTGVRSIRSIHLM